MVRTRVTSGWRFWVSFQQEVLICDQGHSIELTVRFNNFFSLEDPPLRWHLSWILMCLDKKIHTFIINCFKIKYITSFLLLFQKRIWQFQNSDKGIGCTANKLLKKDINWQGNCNVNLQRQKDHTAPEQRSFYFSLKGTW